MLSRKKKKHKIPVHRAADLSKRGFSESDIINILREEGYGPLEVDRALRESLKGGVKKPRFPKVDQLHPFGKVESEYEEKKRHLKKEKPSFETEFDEFEKPDIEKLKREARDRNIPKLPSIPGEPGYEELEISPLPSRRADELSPRHQEPVKDIDEKTKDMIEELVESVIEEKWNTVKRRLDSFERKFEKIEKNIDVAKDDIDDIEKVKSSKVVKLEDRIDDYEKSVSDMNEKMDSMEEVIKNSLTPMMESLRSLSETIRELKRKD